MQKTLKFGETTGSTTIRVVTRSPLRLFHQWFFNAVCSLVIFMPQLSAAQPQSLPLTTGKILYKDASLEKLLPRNTVIEIIGSGFQHIEGPVWLKDSNLLLFSDTKGQIIYSWSEQKGVSTYLTNTGFTGRLPYSEEPGSNGLAIDAGGNLLMCEHGDRRIAAYPLNGKYGRRTVTDRFDGRRFNSPNDVVVQADGSIWFTDPAYGLPLREKDTTRELAFSGVYQLKQPGTNPRLQIRDLPYPNGLAFSADRRWLYVSNSGADHTYIKVYPVGSNGVPGKGKLFFDGRNMEKQQDREVMDGLKTDRDGNVWATGPGGVSVFSAAGKWLGTISTGEVMSNCAWGNDGSTLYITAGSYLYRVKTGASGNF